MSTNWTTANIPSLAGKLFLITGANSGLGFGTTKEIVKKGGRVIMAIRNMTKGQAALNEILKSVPNAKIELAHLDLADLDSVNRFTTTFKNEQEKLDVLINNAGVMMLNERTETQQGFEAQFGTNHIGHFALTGQLLDVLIQTPGSRIVTVSSLVTKMKNARLYWDNLQWENSYDKGAAYGQSKLANLMFALELHEKFKANNIETLSVATHPGYTATNLQQHMGVFGMIMNTVLAQRLEMGILPLLRAATDSTVSSGDYYGPTKIAECRGYPHLIPPVKKAVNAQERQKLWKVSEQLSNVTYQFN